MLEGKIALVTGASRGIGKTIALSLAKEGAYVIVNYNGSEASAKDVISQIEACNGKGEIYQCDVSIFEQVKEMIDTIVTKHNRIDIVVNNAGITRDNLLLKMPEEDFDKVIDTNLKSVFNTSKNVVRYMMKQRSGKIINISSITGIIGNAGQANYCTAKAGINGMTKSLAREIASRGITVNAIAPGFIESEMTATLPESVTKAMLDSIPMKKYGQPEDVANMVVYLASDKANYITGQIIEINGGMNM